MSSLNEQYEILTETLQGLLGNSVTNITVDGQFISPKQGVPSVLIEPPELSVEKWSEGEATWKIDIIAGTTTTQALSLFDCLTVLDKLIAGNLNIASATPVTYLNNGLSLAAYQITLNPFD